MSEEPALSESDFRARVDSIARSAIREYCVEDDGSINFDHATMAAIESTAGSDLIDEYPLSVYEYRVDDAGFGPDSVDYLTSMETMWGHLLELALRQTVYSRITELLDGEWDAIKVEEQTRTVTESRMVFQEEQANGG